MRSMTIGTGGTGDEQLIELFKKVETIAFVDACRWIEASRCRSLPSVVGDPGPIGWG